MNKRTKLLDITSGEYVVFDKIFGNDTLYIEESSMYILSMKMHTNAIKDEVLHKILCFHAVVMKKRIEEFEFIYE
jgi:uncharacterized GH25 family protein